MLLLLAPGPVISNGFLGTSDGPLLGLIEFADLLALKSLSEFEFERMLVSNLTVDPLEMYF